MSPLKTLLLLFVVVGGIGLIITLSIVLTRNDTVHDDCYYIEELEPITSMSSTARDDGLEISWNPVEPIGTCNFTYQVVLTTDLDGFTLPTEEPYIFISRDFFCFELELVIQAVGGRRPIDIGNTRVTYGMSPVNDLELNVFNDNSTIRATWSHVLVGRCGVVYDALFQFANKIISMHRTSVPYINFDLFYCGNTTVSVNAVLLNGVRSETRNATLSEEYPTSIKPVQSVSISISETSAVLSWEISNFVFNCDNLYSVIATNNAISKESICQGTIGCELSLPDFCPTTIFSIRPAPNLEGEEVIETITCESDP